MLHFWTTLLLVVIPTSSCYTFAQTRTGSVVQFKLENYGWQPIPKEQRSEWVGRRSRLVSIDHRGRILVGFTVRENYALASREHPGLSFHILRFTLEGKVDLSIVLPTSNLFNNGIYLSADDHLYARVNNALQFLSEEPNALDVDGVWKTLASCSMNCIIMQSPSHRTLIVREFQDPGHHTFTLLDTSSTIPRTMKSCPWNGFYSEIITDRFGYYSTDGISTDARRRPLCDQEHETELPLGMRNGMISPLSDEAFLLLGTAKDRRGVELVSADGHVKFRREMPKHDIVPPPIWASSDEQGDRFAFTVETWRGGSSFLDIGGKRVARRVVVYSGTGRQLAAISVNPHYYRDFDIAISPDGRRLAILDEGVITIANVE
jgi:hypothetical protein